MDLSEIKAKINNLALSFFIFRCVCICPCEFMPCLYGCLLRPGKGLEFPEIRVTGLMSHWVWALEAELGSSGKVAIACWGILF